MKAFLKYPLIFLAAFLAAGSIAYYTVKIFTQSAEQVILPELRGKNIIYVLETLTQMGLNAKLYGTLYDEKIEKYSVISQDPSPGATIKKGRDVIIYISKGKKLNIMPDLRQQKLSQAFLTLEKNEFKKGHISFTYSSDTRKDYVISQYPKPFASSLKGSACNLLVSKGEIPVASLMPDLTGLSLSSASQRLEKSGLHLSKIKSRLAVEQPQGFVLSQTPLSGSYVSDSTDIELIVTAGESDIELAPDRLNKLIYLTFELEPGFINRHVRIETDLFGSIQEYVNEYLSPGEQIHLLIPSGKKTVIYYYVDNFLKQIVTIDPWQQGFITGDSTWELLPLQSYQQTLQNLQMN